MDPAHVGIAGIWPDTCVTIAIVTMSTIKAIIMAQRLTGYHYLTNRDVFGASPNQSIDIVILLAMMYAP